MKTTLTRYGMPQVMVVPAVVVAVMAVVLAVGVKFLPGVLTVGIEVVLAIVLGWVLSFFRDPERVVPDEAGIFISPADGTVSDIEEIDDEYVGKAVRVGIFLSIFNVHINRAPCAGKVEKITYKPGKYMNAMNPECGKVNEANRIDMVTAESGMKIGVRQISGAIARRIVCELEIGEEMAAGEQFGMIKFGSRTELIYPVDSGMEYVVNIGQKVKAGETILARLKK